MLKSSNTQASFYDASYLCERLIPPDNFYRKFKELVTPLIKDEDFASMYCQDNGRPPISPSLLARACILQSYRAFSDREMEAACMYDIQIKYALGLKLDERPFDHSSLGDFRDRLLKHGKERAAFDNILERLIEKGLLKRDEIQRIDATHIIADVAIPTLITLIKKGVFNVLKPLKKRHRDVWERVIHAIHKEDYERATINQEMPGRLDLEKRKKKLVSIVVDARKVIELTKEVTEPLIISRVRTLIRILNDNTKDGPAGEPVERPTNEKRGDLLVSPVDEDARYGAKSATKKFMGYKANVSESAQSRFITNITAMPGNRPDGESAVDTVTEAQDRHGLTPPKVVADTAYGDGEYRKKLKDKGAQLVAPLRKLNNRSKAVYPKSMFKHDAAAGTLTCPQGVVTDNSWHEARGIEKPAVVPGTPGDEDADLREDTRSVRGRRLARDPSQGRSPAVPREAQQAAAGFASIDGGADRAIPLTAVWTDPGKLGKGLSAKCGMSDITPAGI